MSLDNLSLQPKPGRRKKRKKGKGEKRRQAASIISKRKKSPLTYPSRKKKERGEKRGKGRGGRETGHPAPQLSASRNN